MTTTFLGAAAGSALGYAWPITAERPETVASVGLYDSPITKTSLGLKQVVIKKIKLNYN